MRGPSLRPPHNSSPHVLLPARNSTTSCGKDWERVEKLDMSHVLQLGHVAKYVQAKFRVDVRGRCGSRGKNAETTYVDLAAGTFLGLLLGGS